jgi:hypothetical protein
LAAHACDLVAARHIDSQAISDNEDDFSDEAPQQEINEGDARPLPPTPAPVPPRPRIASSYVSSMSMPDLPRVDVVAPAKKITSSLFLDDFGPRG